MKKKLREAKLNVNRIKVKIKSAKQTADNPIAKLKTTLSQPKGKHKLS